MGEDQGAELAEVHVDLTAAAGLPAVAQFCQDTLSSVLKVWLGTTTLHFSESKAPSK